MKIAEVNRTILRLAGLNRDAAVRVLWEFRATNTPQLRREDWPAVIAAAQRELAALGEPVDPPGAPTPPPATSAPERPLYVWCGE